MLDNCRNTSSEGLKRSRLEKRGRLSKRLGSVGGSQDEDAIWSLLSSLGLVGARFIYNTVI